MHILHFRPGVLAWDNPRADHEIKMWGNLLVRKAQKEERGGKCERKKVRNTSKSCVKYLVTDVANSCSFLLGTLGDVVEYNSE